VPEEESSGAKVALVLGLLMLVGAGLRAWSLGQASLYGDEYGTLKWLQLSPGEIVTSYKGQLTMHLYLLGMQAWTALAGESVLALKIPSLLAGLLTLPLLYRVGRTLVGPQAALVATAAATGSWVLIQYSRFARVYAILVLVVLLLVAAYRKALQEGGARWFLAVVLLIATALALTLNSTYLLVVLGSHTVLLTLWGPQPSRVRGSSLLGCFLAGGLLALAFYGGALAEIQEFRSKWTGAERLRWDWMGRTWVQYFGWLAWPVLLFLGIGCVHLWRQRRENALLLLLWGLLPWIFYTLIRSNHPVTAFPRFLLPTLPALLLLASLGLTQLLRTVVPQRAVALLSAAILLAPGWTSAQYWDRVRQGRGKPYEAAFAHIEASAGPEDVVVNGPIAAEIPRLLEEAEGRASLHRLSRLVESQPPRTSGKLYILAMNLRHALDQWREEFEVVEIEDGGKSTDLLLLIGPQRSAGGSRLRRTLRHFLEGCLHAGEQRPFHDVPSRHYLKLNKIYRQLALICELQNDQESFLHYHHLAGEAMKRKEEEQQLRK
jgi:hypothetical protein